MWHQSRTQIYEDSDWLLKRVDMDKIADEQRVGAIERIKSLIHSLKSALRQRSNKVDVDQQVR